MLSQAANVYSAADQKIDHDIQDPPPALGEVTKTPTDRIIPHKFAADHELFPLAAPSHLIHHPDVIAHELHYRGIFTPVISVIASSVGSEVLNSGLPQDPAAFSSEQFPFPDSSSGQPSGF